MFEYYEVYVMQKVKLRVIPRARQNKIELDENGVYRVHITAAPVDGAANVAVINAGGTFWCAKITDNNYSWRNVT